MATGYVFTTFNRNGTMIVTSPTGEYVENPLVIGIGLAYIAFIVGYILWNDYKDKKK